MRNDHPEQGRPEWTGRAMTQLMWSLQALAQPAEVQIALYPAPLLPTHQLREDFAQSLDAVKGETWSTLSPKHVEALIRIDEKMTEIKKEPGLKDLNPEDTLQFDPQWEGLRALAKLALEVFNWPNSSNPNVTKLEITDPESEACFQALVEIIAEELSVRIIMGDDPSVPSECEIISELIADAVLDAFEVKPRNTFRYQFYNPTP